MAAEAREAWRTPLFALTLLCLPGGAAAWAVASGRWLAGPDQRVLRFLALVLVAVLAALVLAGWVVVLLRRRAAGSAARVRLAELQALSPADFEAWVAQLFRGQGFFVQNVADTADHGVDLRLVSPDGEAAVVQCKRYTGTVGEPALRDLYGVMQAEQASRGYLVTTGQFSRAARRWAAGKSMELVDGQRLVRLANALP